MKHFVVVGGGISGLASAFYLSRAVTQSIGKVEVISCKIPFYRPNSWSDKLYEGGYIDMRCDMQYTITLLEGSARLGGWLDSTEHSDGTVFDHGPRSIRSAGTVGANTLQLAEEVGLADDVIPVTRNHPAARNRYIYTNGQLCPLPNGPGGLLTRSAPFSRSFVRQCWREPFKAAEPREDDSVYDFFSRRFSPEIAHYTADPMCRGIFAGDARQLSVKSCFRMLYDYEQKHGSVVRGVMFAPKDKPAIPREGLVRRSREERWAIWSLRRGIAQLAQAMEEHLRACANVEIRMNTPCTRIDFNGDKAKVVSGEEEIECDHVFATCPSTQLAGMLSHTEHGELTDRLAAVPSCHVAVVNLEYPRNILPVMGFGHLIPSTENTDVMGVVYESCVFPEHNKPDTDTTRLTVMMGGAWFHELFGDPDTTSLTRFEDSAISAIRTQLNTEVEPSKVVVKLQKNCIPQYLIGHDKLVGGAEQYVTDKQLPITLLGASYRGVSVNDCIYNSKKAVENLTDI